MDMSRPQKHILFGLLAVFLIAGAPPDLEAQGPANPKIESQSSAGKKRISINDFIKKVYSSPYQSGTRKFFDGKEILEVTLETVAESVLKRNLAIETKFYDQLISHAALTLAKSSFLPVFNVSGTFENWRTFERFQPLTRDRPKFDDPDTKPPPPRIIVNGQVVSDSEIEQFAPKAGIETASSDSLTKTWTLAPSVSQLLPWGFSFDASLQSVYQRVPTSSTFDFWDRPWTTALSVGFSTPLPYTKDFGPTGAPNDINITLAEINREVAFWDLQSSVNDNLLSAITAYWDLVRSVKRLKATIENRKIIEKLHAHTLTMFQAQRTTAYGKFQVEARLANIKNREEIAWANFFQASNQLANIINLNSSMVILPKRYSKEFKNKLRFNHKTALKKAKRYRPDLIRERKSIKSQKTLVEFRKNQVKPDVKLSGSISRSQSNSVFGYDSWGESMENLFDEDSRNMVIGISFSIPWGNHTVKASLARERVRLKQQEFSVRAVENQVTQEINDALAILNIAQTRIRTTKSNLFASRKSYLLSRNLLRAGRVAEFEMLNKVEDVLTAHLSYVDALIEHKKAEYQLLAAEGKLGEMYLK